MSVTLPSKTKKDKKIILNLNNYRNLHYRISNDAKIQYKKDLKIDSIEKFSCCELEYKYFHGNNRPVDLSNPCSVIDKFACDALTELGFWKDDNINHIKKVTYVWGGVDKDNPRCELTINEL